MDFFGEQARARRKSRWLTLWFVLAVLFIVLTIYFIAIIAFASVPRFSGAPPEGSAFNTLPMSSALITALLHNNGAPFPWRYLWHEDYFLWTFLLVGGGIGLASLYKIHQLSRKGGAIIAAELGGRYISRETTAPEERRLLNVVDEISIAAGIPAPQVFLLDDEKDLNAFAAGTTPANSVVAVTRGLLDQLERDELQGVIGHEISHIVNGDARLNLRLIGVLHGILILSMVGRVLTRARGKNAGGVVLLGLCLCLIGVIGVFFGRLIKAAVSREREYLADAAAVQFTRNPNGIAGALRRIGRIGSHLQHPRAEEASHLFFGGSAKLSFLPTLLATHPPIKQRIARIENIDPALLAANDGAPAAPVRDDLEETLAISFLNAAGGAQIGYAQDFLAALPPALAENLNHPSRAVAVVFGLLLSSRPDIQKAQLDAITRAYTQKTAHEALTHQQWLGGKNARHRLPLLDMALPALRELDADARKRCLECVDRLVYADGRLSASEFALRHILKSILAPAVARLSLRLEKLDADIACLLAFIAHTGNADEAAAAAAYQHALARSPIGKPQAFPARKELRLEQVEHALSRLAQANPRFREKLLQACVAAVEHDGKITPAESELLRAFAQSLDCPIPPSPPSFLASAANT
jgi:Zn-dependent protease with chaperone function